MVNDILSDFLTKIRNANNSKHQIVEVISTKVTISIAQILKNEGFIYDFQIFESQTKNSLIISLKYIDQNYHPVLHDLTRISKPGIRVYVSKKKLKNFSLKTGISIISTSKGIMTNHQAKKLNLGGEVLCLIA